MRLPGAAALDGRLGSPVRVAWASVVNYAPKIRLPTGPGLSTMIRTTKELDPASSDDLDAGWDVSDSTPPAISVQQPSALTTRLEAAQLDEEIDAGWDLGPDQPAAAAESTSPLAPDSRQPRYSEIHLRGEPSNKQPAATQPAVSNSSAHRLTKKERRQIERQQQIHAAKKQAQSKAERRLQRKQASDAVVPAVPAPTVASPSNANKRRRKPKPNLHSKPLAGSASRRMASPSRTAAPNASPPDSARNVADSAPAIEESPTHSRRSPVVMYVTIAVVLLALALLYFAAGRHQ